MFQEVKSKKKNHVVLYIFIPYCIMFPFFSYFAMTKSSISRIFYSFLHIDMRQDRAYARQKVKSNSPCFKNKSFLFSVNFFLSSSAETQKKTPTNKKKDKRHNVLHIIMLHIFLYSHAKHVRPNVNNCLYLLLDFQG